MVKSVHPILHFLCFQYKRSLWDCSKPWSFRLLKMAFLSIPRFHYPIQLARNFYGPMGNNRGKSKFSIVEIFPIFFKKSPVIPHFQPSQTPGSHFRSILSSILHFAIIGMGPVSWTKLSKYCTLKNAAKFLCNHRVMSLLDKGHLKTKQKLYFRRVMSCDRTKMRHMCAASNRVDPYWTLDLPWGQ